MLPPVDPAVLQRNPKLEIVYKDLCTRKLNADGSTRDSKKQRIHDEIRRNLTTARTQHHESEILVRTLSDLPSKAADLPPELHAVIELVAAQLSGRISLADRETLSGDVNFFVENVSTIADALSEQLTTVVSILCRIADPTHSPPGDQLVQKAEHLQDQATHALPKEILDARVHLANTAHAVLSLHRQILESAIRILEQTKHGSLARATKGKAEFLQARAALLGLQARIYTLMHPPPPEFVNALKNYRAGQGTSMRELEDRRVVARRALDLYVKAGEKGMRDAARRAVFLKKEIQRTEDEIRKLEHGE